MYQYYEAIEQDVEGSLVIDTMSVGGIETMSVTDGTCQDFFEFRMVRNKDMYIHSLTLHIMMLTVKAKYDRK